MGHSHDTVFVALSLGVAILASWTALGLLERVRANLEGRRIIWLAATAGAMGGGIWSMHFIAMQGFDPGVPFTYDVGLTILSLGLAFAGTFAAFWMAAKPQARLEFIVTSGAAMGIAIALMHYVGMAAIRSAADLSFHPGFVAASLAVAVMASFWAMVLVRSDLSIRQKVIGSVVLALAVVAMHYTAMMGTVVEIGDNAVSSGHETSGLTLATITALVTVVLLIASAVIAHLDRRIKLLTVLDAGDIGYWEVRLPSRQVWLSPHARKLLFRPVEMDGKTILQDHTPALIDAAIAMAKLAIRTANTTHSKEMEIQLGNRWVAVRGRMLMMRRQHHIKMAGILIDITEAHNVRTALEFSDARQKLLLNELNHRLKNNFASIQSIAALTARGSADLPSFIETFQSRLMALSNTQTLLTNTGWESADIAAIFEQELHPYTQQAVIEGPTLLLDPKRALAMGLIAHELTTNAAKHGALSRPNGVIKVRWTQPDRNGKVRLEWRETGGPPAVPPARKGFGSRLIRNSIEGALGGSANLEYLQTGLKVSLQFTTADAPPAVKTAPKVKVIKPVD
ncbi:MULTISPECIES: MHYT domain-containing protein [unclassified Brevundimonas]|uniref:MHYT domain-containing protein n=1 Tax=unclassified Brevundimonas TaxID=2622653 RepID=UPI0025BA3A3E|nr:MULTISPECIES: MHYT domain-containing protein [unclassified Brevundimonas]